MRAFAGFRWNHYALSLAMLVVVVFALAVLQYGWIDQVSEAQEARATSRVREKLRLVTDAFDTEITRAVLVFTSPSALWAPMPDKLEQAWTTWNHEAPWPRIVSGVSYLEPDDDGWKVRTWGAAGTLDPRSILPAEDLVSSRSRGDVLHVAVNGRALFVDGRPCVLWPLPIFRAPPESPRFDRLLICYDLSYLADVFFPRLLEKYSAAEERNDFLFHLEPRGPVASGTVMTVDQFHHRPDCLMSVARGEPSFWVSGVVSGSTERPRGSQSGAVEISPRHDVDGTAPSTSILHAEGACEAAAPVDTGLMHVSVRRPPGSLTDLFTRFRQRNLFVSGLVMMALVAGLIAFVVSTEQARRLARLQTVIAAGISHELRSPLASLNVAADHLKNGHSENPLQPSSLPSAAQPGNSTPSGSDGSPQSGDDSPSVCTSTEPCAGGVQLDPLAEKSCSMITSGIEVVVGGNRQSSGTVLADHVAQVPPGTQPAPPGNESLCCQAQGTGATRSRRVTPWVPWITFVGSARI
jgi:hypothetical protein